MLLLDLSGISFHVVVVFDLDKDLLFKSVLFRTLDMACVAEAPTQQNSRMFFGDADTMVGLFQPPASKKDYYFVSFARNVET